MSKPEESDSPPLICKETTKLVESMETSEEQIFKFECLLEHKRTYYDQLQQHENRLSQSNAEKRAVLSIVNNSASFVNTKNSYCREKGKEQCVRCHAACQDINDIEATLAVCEAEEKVVIMSKSLDQDNAQYEKKIDDLIKLLEQLTEKRKKKLDALKLQEKELREENFELNNQSKIYEKDEAFIDDETDSSDIGDLENELKDLQSKLLILDEEYSKMNEEDRSYEAANEVMGNTFHESVFAELETQCAQINSESQELSQKLERQKELEQETVSSYQTLEEYEKKLNEELTQTEKFWENVDQTRYGGFSKLEQEIGNIKSDIIDRNEKYGVAQEEQSKHIEILKKKDDEIGEISPKVDQIATELEEIENCLENLKTSDDLSQQYDAAASKITDMHNKKVLLEKTVLEKEVEVENFVNQLQKCREKGDLDILSLENNNLMEIKELEKQYTNIEATKVKIENEAKSSETEIKELEDAKQALQEKTEGLAKNLKDLEETVEEGQKNLKTKIVKKEEAKKKLASLTIIPPIYVRKNAPQVFATPKTPEAPKKTPKKTLSPKAKRNWDSDSSVEGGEISLSESLNKNKKYRRRQDSGK